jgi:hypothetical protein
VTTAHRCSPSGAANEPFFLPAGAEAFKRDVPDADVRFFETGHFALETHCADIAAAIRRLPPRAVGSHRVMEANEAGREDGRPGADVM